MFYSWKFPSTLRITEPLTYDSPKLIENSSEYNGLLKVQSNEDELTVNAEQESVSNNPTPKKTNTIKKKKFTKSNSSDNIYKPNIISKEKRNISSQNLNKGSNNINNRSGYNDERSNPKLYNVRGLNNKMTISKMSSSKLTSSKVSSDKNTLANINHINHNLPIHSNRSIGKTSLKNNNPNLPIHSNRNIGKASLNHNNNHNLPIHSSRSIGKTSLSNNNIPQIKSINSSMPKSSFKNKNVALPKTTTFSNTEVMKKMPLQNFNIHFGNHKYNISNKNGEIISSYPNTTDNELSSKLQNSGQLINKKSSRALNTNNINKKSSRQLTNNSLNTNNNNINSISKKSSRVPINNNLNTNNMTNRRQIMKTSTNRSLKNTQLNATSRKNSNASSQTFNKKLFNPLQNKNSKYFMEKLKDSLNREIEKNNKLLQKRVKESKQENDINLIQDRLKRLNENKRKNISNNAEEELKTSLSSIPKKKIKHFSVSPNDKKGFKKTEKLAISLKKKDYLNKFDPEKYDKFHKFNEDEISKINYIQKWWKFTYKIILIQKNFRGYLFRKVENEYILKINDAFYRWRLYKTRVNGKLILIRLLKNSNENKNIKSLSLIRFYMRKKILRILLSYDKKILKDYYINLNSYFNMSYFFKRWSNKVSFSKYVSKGLIFLFIQSMQVYQENKYNELLINKINVNSFANNKPNTKENMPNSQFRITNDGIDFSHMKNNNGNNKSQITQQSSRTNISKTSKDEFAHNISRNKKFYSSKVVNKPKILSPSNSNANTISGEIHGKKSNINNLDASPFSPFRNKLKNNDNNNTINEASSSSRYRDGYTEPIYMLSFVREYFSKIYIRKLFLFWKDTIQKMKIFYKLKSLLNSHTFREIISPEGVKFKDFVDCKKTISKEYYLKPYFFKWGIDGYPKYNKYSKYNRYNNYDEDEEDALINSKKPIIIARGIAYKRKIDLKKKNFPNEYQIVRKFVNIKKILLEKYYLKWFNNISKHPAKVKNFTYRNIVLKGVLSNLHLICLNNKIKSDNELIRNKNYNTDIINPKILNLFNFKVKLESKIFSKSFLTWYNISKYDVKKVLLSDKVKLKYLLKMCNRDNSLRRIIIKKMNKLNKRKFNKLKNCFVEWLDLLAIDLDEKKTVNVDLTEPQLLKVRSSVKHIKDVNDHHKILEEMITYKKNEHRKFELLHRMLKRNNNKLTKEYYFKILRGDIDIENNSFMKNYFHLIYKYTRVKYKINRLIKLFFDKVKLFYKQKKMLGVSKVYQNMLLKKTYFNKWTKITKDINKVFLKMFKLSRQKMKNPYILNNLNNDNMRYDDSTTEIDDTYTFFPKKIISESINLIDNGANRRQFKNQPFISKINSVNRSNDFDSASDNNLIECACSSPKKVNASQVIPRKNIKIINKYKDTSELKSQGKCLSVSMNMEENSKNNLEEKLFFSNNNHNNSCSMNNSNYNNISNINNNSNTYYILKGTPQTNSDDEQNMPNRDTDEENFIAHNLHPLKNSSSEPYYSNVPNFNFAKKATKVSSIDLNDDGNNNDDEQLNCNYKFNNNNRRNIKQKYLNFNKSSDSLYDNEKKTDSHQLFIDMKKKFDNKAIKQIGNFAKKYHKLSDLCYLIKVVFINRRKNNIRFIKKLLYSWERLLLNKKIENETFDYVTDSSKQSDM